MTSWTDEQVAIFDHFLTGPEHLSEDAKAGSGKTSTNVEGAKQLARAKPGISILATAFNVKIKKELEKKLNGSATVLTLNGLGHRAWGKALNKFLKLEKNKMGLLTTGVVKDWDRQDAWGSVRQLATAAKTWGIVPVKAPRATGQLLPDTEENWIAVADHFDLDYSEEIADMARVVLTQSILQGYDGTIDFDDQIYLPVMYGSGFERYDLVIGDEWQDLNPLNHIMIDRSVKLAGRIAAVGDKYQAIYGFRGADIEAMRKFRDAHKAKELTLSVCWRCGADIIAHAQELVPEIKPAPGAASGRVHYLDNWDETLFQAGDAILCRNNAPIIGLAFRLIRHGRGVHVIGRDLGTNLKNLIKKILRGNENHPIEFLEQELKRWEYREIQNARGKGDEDLQRKVEDKAESLRAVITYGGCKTISEVKQRIDFLFSKESAPITLSTIHKSKGLEWRRVFALDAHLLSPDWLTRDWAITCDRNLDYVQRTRAIEELCYIKSSDWRKDDEA